MKATALTFKPIEDDGAGFSDSLTNTIMQVVQAELRKAGLRGGLGDSRELRLAVSKIVNTDMAATFLHSLQQHAEKQP